MVLDIADELDTRELAKKIINYVVEIVQVPVDYCALVRAAGNVQDHRLRVTATYDGEHRRTRIHHDSDDMSITVPWTIINYVGMDAKTDL
jgi:hypothetical protein